MMGLVSHCAIVNVKLHLGREISGHLPVSDVLVFRNSLRNKTDPGEVKTTMPAVKGYTYKRKGKVITVGGYLRKVRKGRRGNVEVLLNDIQAPSAYPRY